MSEKLKVWYEPHPVTPERKAELRAKGFRIIDARFAPLNWAPAEEDRACYTAHDMADAQAKAFREGAHGDLTDDQLRDAIKVKTGKAPHWKSNRATLLQQYAELSHVA